MLEAAAALFRKNGYAGTTLDAVISQAGGSRATLYEAFGGKEELFAAIIDRLGQRIAAPLVVPAPRPRDTLLAAGKALMAALMSEEGLGLYRILIAESQRFPKLAAATFAAGPTAAADHLARYFAKQTRDGTLEVPVPGLAARQFLEMVKGDLHLRALLGLGRPPGKAEIARCVVTAVDLFLSGATPRGRHRR
jgi:AcrR family transcriptional regulator